MKRIIISIVIIASLSSCQKCYQCKTTTTYIRWDGSIYGKNVNETNFCGTVSQKTKHEKESSSVVDGVNNSKTVTEMECIAD